MSAGTREAAVERGTAGQSVAELLSTLIQQISLLLRKELQFARAETAEKLGTMADAAGYIGGGLLFMGAALMMVLTAAVYGLIALGLNNIWSTLLVGIAAAVVGVLLLLRGIRSVKARRPTVNNNPDRGPV